MTAPNEERDEEIVRFQFDFRGIEVEIAGDRAYVDGMYQELMRDIEAARRGAAEHNESLAIPDEEPVVWLHRCSDMMRKIYMTTSDDLSFTLLSNSIDPDVLSTVYVDKRIFDRFLPNITKERTLWAELTEEGRKKIGGSSS